MKILIVEDEKDLIQSMADYLRNSGLECDTAMNLKEALEKIENHYDCLVLDIGLPDGSGFRVIEEINKMTYQPGIVIVSAKHSLDDRLKGLNLGADDYIVKPFHMSELLARINSVYRTLTSHDKKEIVLDELRLIPDEMMFYVNNKNVSLTKKEYDLLMFLLNNRNRVLTKEAIAEHLWGQHSDMAESFDFIYSHIKNLRKKIMDQGGKDYVKSIYGVGYKFSVD